MPTKRHPVKTYFNNEEVDRLDELVAQLRLSRSEFLLRLAMAYRMPDPSDFVAWQGIRDLLKVNADLARLGNLFKLALDEPLPVDLLRQLDAIKADIAETQTELKACARAIRAIVQPSRS